MNTNPTAIRWIFCCLGAASAHATPAAETDEAMVVHALGGPSGELFLVREDQGEYRRQTLLQDVVRFDCAANGRFVVRVKSGSWLRGNANAPGERAELPADSVPPYAQYAYIAPDGRTIAWRAVPDRGKHILIVRSHGPGDWKDLRVVSDHYLGAAAWSPAGDKLAYYSGGPQAASEDGFRLMLLDPVAQAEPKELAPPSLLTRLSPIRPDPPEWSPDGRLIRFEGRYGDAPLGKDLCIVGVDGAGLRLSPPGRVWSADGTGFFAIDGAPPDGVDQANALLMIDMNGRERRRTELGPVLAGVRGGMIMCSPTGRRLAYVADRQLHIFDLTARQDHVLGPAGPGSHVVWLDQRNKE